MAKDGGKVALIVGTYAHRSGGGLRALLSAPSQLEAGPELGRVADASHGLWSQDRETLYLVSEQPRGFLHALQSGEHGLTEVWRAETGGAAPCHLALVDGGAQLVAANYESGSVATVLTAGGRGKTLYQLCGTGPNLERQARPHAHWVGCAPGTDRLYCVDLGSDTIWRFDPNASAPVVAFFAPPGSGPRHLAFHRSEPLAFLVSELASTVTLLSREADFSLRPVASWSTLPTGSGEGLGGHILLDRAAERLYVTNRGHDSVAVFAVEDHSVRLLQHIDCGGASPRHMLLLEDERRLLVANEEGGTVRQFAVAHDGTLATEATIEIPGAAFLIEAS